MGTSKHTLAIVAITATLVGCSSRPLPAVTPTAPVESLRVYTTTAVYPLMADLTRAYSELHPMQRFDIRQGNYQVLLTQLQAGEITHFMSNHLSAASGLWAAPVGVDGLAIVVNPDVRITGVTLGELRAIYQGRITNWQDLGGARAEIVVLSRESGSGTRAEFDRMVMGYRQTTSNAMLATSSLHMMMQVAQTPGSIGYVSMGYVDAPARVLAVDGVLPTPQTVLNHRYPLRATLFVVGLGEPEGAYRAWLGWVQGLSGQAVVSGRYAPLMDVAPEPAR